MARPGRGRPKEFANLSEIGHSGLNSWGGEIKEEFVKELRGKEGRRIYREMWETDPIIGAMGFAITSLIRQAMWHAEPNPKNTKNKEPADFLDSCMNDMSETWADTISEILTFLIYGWSYTETVFKKREGFNRDPSRNSKWTDGQFGWRKLPLRGQNSLKRWSLDKQGGIQGMTQSVRTTEGLIEKTIPIEKALLFRTTIDRNNPEGRSILKASHKSWYFKKRIEEIEGIGIERDLAGLPVLIGPEDGPDLWDANDTVAIAARSEAETIVRNIRRDEQEGVLLPFGWELSLLSSAGKRNFDTTEVIGRYNNSMAMTMLADFIILGHNNRYGSFALSSSKTHMFAMACAGVMDIIEGVFNRYAIPRLFFVNAMDMENLPVLKHGDIELPDLDELGNYIYRLSQAGFKIFPNPPIEEALLKAGGMPTQDVELGREAEPPPTGVDPVTGKPIAGKPGGPNAAGSKPAGGGGKPSSTNRQNTGRNQAGAKPAKKPVKR